MWSKKTVLPVTIPMSKFPEQYHIKVLHLEPTDACNAACPQCARELMPTFDKNQSHHLTVNNIKLLLEQDLIKNLDKMFMCGVFGDPAAGKYTLDIFRYFRSVNPEIVLGMNSNGSLKTTRWWQELATILNQPQDYVVFSIDGLSDTNHIYRVNTQWSKIMQSAESFIKAGGRAHWDMLVFEHNKHQVDQAMHLAKDLGFKWFRAKISRRNSIYPIKFLNPPKSWTDPVVAQGKISCQILKDQSMYVSAQGKIYPCCWLGKDSEYTMDKFSDVVKSWNSDPVHTCQITCTESLNQNSYTNQWQREVEL
jgi:MoaA/NifB/PqqE/SkfB family radical SAM enzyme